MEPRVRDDGVVTPSTRVVELPRRGPVTLWECAGPPGAETLVLLHGVTLTAQLNWAPVLPALGRHFRVLAIDQRGHGRGETTGGRFRLEQCADDVAALAESLNLPPLVAVGYSMGGMVAQLVHRRHPDLLSGLVLCSTARNVRGSAIENLVALTLPALATAIQWNPVAEVVGAEILGTMLVGHIADPEKDRWVRAELRRTRLTTAVDAMHAVCDFTSHRWIGDVDVPTAVLVTARDRIVPPSRQRRLAAAIPGAAVYEVDADHGVAITDPELFAPSLLDACRHVATRAMPGRAAAAASGNSA